MSIDRTGWVNIGGMNHFLDEYQQFTDRFITGVTGEEFFFALRNEKDFLRAYNECSPLKSIIGKRGKAFNTGKTIIVNTNTEKILRGNDWLKKLIKKPNVLQNEDQFHAQQNAYVDIFGYCPVLKVRSAGLEAEISSLWNIPSWLFDIDYTKKWLKQFRIDGIYRKYYMLWDGERIELDMKDLFFIFDDGIGTQDDTNLTIPDSRLVGNDYTVSNIIAAMKSRNTLITKRGAIGILSNDASMDHMSIPFRADKKGPDGKVIELGTKGQLQRDFSKYGLTGQPFQIIITDAQLKWQQMGYPTKDLMLFEETQENIERLADAYGWPIELIARGKDVTYDNKIQARKDLYQNTIIPESDSRMEQFSRGLELEGIEVKKDFSKVPVLQSDKKLQAETRKLINEYCKTEYDEGLMTKNDWREQLGLPRIEGKPEYDELKEPTEETDEDEPIKVKLNGKDTASKNKGIKVKK